MSDGRGSPGIIDNKKGARDDSRAPTTWRYRVTGAYRAGSSTKRPRPWVSPPSALA